MAGSDSRGIEGINRRHNWSGGKFVCKRCGMDGVLKVSRSSDNPNRVYGKCPSCGKFLGWLDECEENGSKTAATVNTPLPTETSDELLEMKKKVAEAMLLLFMCKNDVGDLVMSNNNLIEEIAVMRMQVAASVLEVAEMRRDLSESMDKMTELIDKATELKVI